MFISGLHGSTTHKFIVISLPSPMPNGTNLISDSLFLEIWYLYERMVKRDKKLFRFALSDRCVRANMGAVSFHLQLDFY